METLEACISDLPIDLKERLLALSKRLPESARKPFLRNVVKRLGKLAKDFKYTTIYSLAGFVIGEVLDNFLTVNIPLIGDVELTGDIMSHVMGVAGLVLGAKTDHARHAEENQIRTIVAEELKRAFQSAE